MKTTEQYLRDIINQKQNMVEILNLVGIEASNQETLNILIPKFTEYISNTAELLEYNTVLADAIPNYDTKTYIDDAFAQIETTLISEV